MKQLKCEMCGGTDIIKQDGLYVCQSCGVKYSVEEARKMMIEGVVDVRILHDDENRILKKQADEAFEEERFADATRLYADLLNKQDCDYETVFRRWFAQANCRGSIFNKLPHQYDSLETLVKKLYPYFEQLLNDSSISDSSKSNKIISTIQKIEDIFWNSIWHEKNVCLTLPQYYTNNLNRCVKIYDILYDAAIKISQNFLSVCVFVKRNLFEEGYSVTKNDLEGYGLSDVLKKHRNRITNVEKYLIEKQKANRRIKYWEQNEQKKKELEAEQKKLMEEEKTVQAQINEIKRKLNGITSKPLLTEKKAQIDELKRKKESCGLFKFKEKKAIQEQIDYAEQEKEQLIKQIEMEKSPIQKELATYDKKISTIRKRINEISSEFTKDR